MGPAEYGPGEAVGAPDHPHRGFETVTYMLDGEFVHEDSAGHSGTIRPGDVQWMTAGAGIVHAEMPSSRIRKEGGRVHGFQIWINLPAKFKMTQPRYQGITAERIPKASSADGLATVRVVAGEALGASAIIDTHTPIVYQHWTLREGADVVLPLSAEHNVLVYVFGGAIRVEDRPLSDGQLGILGAGDAVVVDTGNRFVQVAAQAMREVYGKDTVFIRTGGSIPIVAAFGKHLNAPALLMGFGLPDCAAHGPNEKFALENFYGGIESLIHLFEKLGALPKDGKGERSQG